MTTISETATNRTYRNQPCHDCRTMDRPLMAYNRPAGGPIKLCRPCARRRLYE